MVMGVAFFVPLWWGNPHLCYPSAMTASPRRSSAPHPDQLEFRFAPSVSAGFTVQRVENHIVLTQKPIEAFGSVADAAHRLRRSERWVRILCEAGVIPARKLPGAKMWDIDMIALEEWIAAGDRVESAANLRNYRQSRQRVESL